MHMAEHGANIHATWSLRSRVRFRSECQAPPALIGGQDSEIWGTNIHDMLKHEIQHPRVILLVDAPSFQAHF